MVPLGLSLNTFIILFSVCRDHDPIPDVEFHNPLYNGHSRPDIMHVLPVEENQSNHDTGDACSEADDQISVNNTSEIFIHSENESENERTECVTSFEHDLSTSEMTSLTNDVIPSSVYIDCLTTL